MKGLVFLGAEAPPIDKNPLNFSTFNYIVAADSGLDTALLHGALCQTVIGDMDSLSNSALLDNFDKSSIKVYPEKKDASDGELAFDYLLDKGCKNISLFGGGGGRLDHLLTIRALFERSLPPIRWLTGHEDIFTLDKNLMGGEGYWRGALEEEFLVSLLPLGAGPWQAKSSGLYWPLDGVPWSTTHLGRGLSNRAMGGKIEIQVLKGRFLLILPIGEVKLEEGLIWT